MNDTDNLVYKEFLALIEPDPELAQLAEAFVSLADRLTAERSHLQEVRDGIRQLDLKLIDVESAERKELLTTRAILCMERDSLPVTIAELEERHTAARIAYHKRMNSLAWEWGRTWLAEVKGIDAELNGVMRKLGGLSIGQGDWSKLEAQRQELAVQVRPFNRKLDQSRATIHVSDDRIRILERSMGKGHFLRNTQRPRG